MRTRARAQRSGTAARRTGGGEYSLPPSPLLPSYFSVEKDWLTRLVAVVRRRRIAAAGARLGLGRAVRSRVGAGLVFLWVEANGVDGIGLDFGRLDI